MIGFGPSFASSQRCALKRAGLVQWWRPLDQELVVEALHHVLRGALKDAPQGGEYGARARAQERGDKPQWLVAFRDDTGGAFACGEGHQLGAQVSVLEYVARSEPAARQVEARQQRIDGIMPRVAAEMDDVAA